MSVKFSKLTFSKYYLSNTNTIRVSNSLILSVWILVNCLQRTTKVAASKERVNNSIIEIKNRIENLRDMFHVYLNRFEFHFLR